MAQMHETFFVEKNFKLNIYKIGKVSSVLSLLILLKLQLKASALKTEVFTWGDTRLLLHCCLIHMFFLWFAFFVWHFHGFLKYILLPRYKDGVIVGGKENIELIFFKQMAGKISEPWGILPFDAEMHYLVEEVFIKFSSASTNCYCIIRLRDWLSGQQISSYQDLYSTYINHQPSINIICWHSEYSYLYPPRNSYIGQYFQWC